jgi:hypothetical protein
MDQGKRKQNLPERRAEEQRQELPSLHDAKKEAIKRYNQLLMEGEGIEEARFAAADDIAKKLEALYTDARKEMLTKKQREDIKKLYGIQESKPMSHAAMIREALIVQLAHYDTDAIKFASKKESEKQEIQAPTQPQELKRMTEDEVKMHSKKILEKLGTPTSEEREEMQTRVNEIRRDLLLDAQDKLPDNIHPEELNDWFENWKSKINLSYVPQSIQDHITGIEDNRAWGPTFTDRITGPIYKQLLKDLEKAEFKKKKKPFWKRLFGRN